MSNHSHRLMRSPVRADAAQAGKGRSGRSPVAALFRRRLVLPTTPAPWSAHRTESALLSPEKASSKSFWKCHGEAPASPKAVQGHRWARSSIAARGLGWRSSPLGFAASRTPRNSRSSPVSGDQECVPISFASPHRRASRSASGTSTPRDALKEGGGSFRQRIGTPFSPRNVVTASTSA